MKCVSLYPMFGCVSRQEGDLWQQSEMLIT